MAEDQTLSAIVYKRGQLSILDQLKLPDQSIYLSIETVNDAWNAIHQMSIRGAPAIAVCGVLSVAVELERTRTKYGSIDDVQQFVAERLNHLVTARPTAVNMADATKTIIDYSISLVEKQNQLEIFIDEILKFMEKYLENDLSDNRSIGRFGAEAIRRYHPSIEKLTVLTHCNTGSLATVGFGTALGVIRQLLSENSLELAYFTETRPYNQGSRLTAFEMIHDRIPHTMICDSMAGLLMKTRRVHAVVVGADRVTANGDTANKIGTYQLAILSKYHNIPFYIAAPTTSIDLKKRTGDEIIIEERPAKEMTTIKGVKIAADGVQVWNPGFDVTPASLITGIITEHGVFTPAELEEKLLSIRRS